MKILPAARTGVCAWHQRKLTAAIKRSRIMALLSATHK
jgi:ribosomal protein S18